MTYSAYAKINLTLDITGIREDGYHNIESVMQTVSLRDLLTVDVTERKKGSAPVVVASSDFNLPTDGKNLCFRACELFMKEFGITDRAVSVYIDKKIPVGAGLGGGSSDCAATLNALNGLFGVNASAEKLEELGGKIGSDVPFFIKGGCRRVSGTGTVVSDIAVSDSFYAVIAKPEELVLTKDAYKDFDRLFGTNKELFPQPSTAKFLSGKTAAERFASVSNMLAPVAESRLKAVTVIKKELKALGAEAAEMTGSGSSVFGVFLSERAATEALSELKNRVNTGFSGVYKSVFNNKSI